MKRLAFLVFCLIFLFFIDLPAQSNNWQKGFFNREPQLSPENVPAISEFKEESCQFLVRNKAFSAKIVTEKCKEGDKIFKRNIIFAPLSKTKEGAVLTIRTEDECWVNNVLFSLGTDPSNFQYARALYNFKDTYSHYKGSKYCGRVFNNMIPNE